MDISNPASGEGSLFMCFFKFGLVQMCAKVVSKVFGVQDISIHE